MNITKTEKHGNVTIHTVATNGKPVRVQDHGGKFVRGAKNKCGTRYAVIFPSLAHAVCGTSARPVPLEIASVAAGRNAWMRDIVVKCDCGTRFQLKDNDSHGHCCTACWDKAEAELED